MTLRISEIYSSIQGEGPRVGTPTTFVRFAGCNLKCPGWPCDTPHAIDPKIFTKEQRLLSVDQVADEIVALGNDSVCFTGGEPLLQNHSDLVELAQLLTHGSYELECFSNGTIEYDSLAAYVSIVMDWKLPGSGEYGKGSAVRLQNLDTLAGRYARVGHVVKFTIADRLDYDTAKQIYFDYLVNAPVAIYVGVVWGKLDDAELVKWILDSHLPWKYNMQIHNIIWDRSQRGI